MNLDPVLLKDIIAIGAFYIEGGARSFASFSAKMIEDLGEGVRKYIQPAYDELRKRTDIDTTGMDRVVSEKPPPAEILSPARQAPEPAATPPPAPVAEAPSPPLCKAEATNTSGAVYGPKNAAWAGVPLPKATPAQQTPTDLAKTEKEKLINEFKAEFKAEKRAVAETGKTTTGKTFAEYLEEKRKEARKRIQSRKLAYNVENEANKTVEAIPEQKIESPSLKRQTYQVFFNNEAD